MKTKSILAFTVLAAAAFAADAASQPACCANCSAEKNAAPATTAAALSVRSLYQLDAQWTDDAGKPFTLASLRGRPVVVAMFFANCEYACPVIVSDMRRIGDALPASAQEKVQFVLVSFDTDRDTPAALQAYRARMGLPGNSWTLLHGDASAVQELSMLLGVNVKKDARGQFSHSNLITVLNKEGEITHQRAGLSGDVSEAAKVVTLAAR